MRQDQRFARRAAIVTGAGGGIGKACARRLSTRFSLILNDYNADALGRCSAALREEDGAEVTAEIAGDLGDPEVLSRIAAAAGTSLGPIVHTAGRASGTSTWRGILDTNLAATARLLTALEPLLAPGIVAVLMASISRFLAPTPSRAMLAAMENPLSPDFLDRMGNLLAEEDKDEMEQRRRAYRYSKWWVQREVQRRAIAWAGKGARIMSISPGMTWTAMGRLEVETGVAAPLVDGTPIPRWGTPGDIADAVEFIISDRATFLTGSDILVDGGLAARILTQGL